MQGPRSGEITRALARAREGRGGETRRRSTVARRDARRLTVFAPAKEVHTLMPYRELRVVPLKLTSPTTARNDARRRRRADVRITRRDISKVVLLQALSGGRGSDVRDYGERIGRARDRVGSHPRVG
jgi:hypothetical protein